MIIYDGIMAASDGAVGAYINAQEQLPEHMTTLLGPLMTGGSPVDRICRFTESVYANRGQPGVSTDMLAVAAGCGAVIAMYGFWGSLDGRAAGMVLALRRDSGEAPEEGFAWPDPSEDPAPKAEYLPPAPPPIE